MMAKRKFRITLLVVGALILVVALWAMNWLLIDWPIDQRGTLGDMFGVVNALFSGLAFAGIILTIYMQKHELEMQRNELEETREVFQTQTELMNQQQNDATFFSLLENHRNLVDSLKQGFVQRYTAHGEFQSKLQDTVSGYAYIEKLMAQWQTAFASYLLAEKDHLLVHPIHTKYATLLQYLDDSPKMRNLVGDIRHISLFIESHMADNNTEFYTETLWHNLSEGEKFMVELFGVYYPNYTVDAELHLNVYSKLNFPDFRAFTLPVVVLESIDIDDEEILKISSQSTISEVRYFTYKDYGKSVTVFEKQKLSPLPDQPDWYLDISKLEIEPYKDGVEPNVGIAVNVVYNETDYLFLAEISFDMEPEDGDWEISQNGWNPMTHRLAKQLSKQI